MRTACMSVRDWVRSERIFRNRDATSSFFFRLNNNNETPR